MTCVFHFVFEIVGIDAHTLVAKQWRQIFPFASEEDFRESYSHSSWCLGFSVSRSS